MIWPLLLAISMAQETPQPPKKPLTTTSEIGKVKMIGAGLIFGFTNGLSGKFYLGDPLHALDIALAWRSWDGGRNNGGWAYLHVTYLIHPGELYFDPKFVLRWHVGGGGFVQGGNRWSNNGSELGARGAIGLDMDFVPFPLQLFADLSLDVGLAPEVWIWPGLSIGARWYF